MSNGLLIASAVALALLVVHCWKLRAWNVTRAFFLAAIAFGFIRGNLVWLFFTRINEGVSADRPFVCPDGRFSVGHAYLLEAVGWAFALYLAWSVSEFILRRLPRLRARIFLVAGLSSIFMLAICYCMETAAVLAGWWRWELPTRNDLFGNVNSFAMTAWFSVVPDFLLPFLVIVCTPFRNRRWYVRWAWTLCFIPHTLGVLFLGWRAWTHITTVVLALSVVGLALYSRLPYFLGEVDDAKGGRLVRALPAAALAIFFAVLFTATLSHGGGLAEFLTAAPLLMMCLLAWKRVPANVVAALSVAAVVVGWGFAGMGPRALWAIVPVGIYGVLRLLERTEDPLRVLLPASAAALILSAVVIVANVSDLSRAERYAKLWASGDRQFLEGNPGGAMRDWGRVKAQRPLDTINLYCSIPKVAIAPPDDFEDFGWMRRRLIAEELREVLRRDPDWALPRRDLDRVIAAE